MSSPLSGLASTIGKALTAVFFSATLTRSVAGVSIDPADPVASTATSYSCRALIDEFSLEYKASGTVDAEDRSVLILASTLAVAPISGDVLTINEGPLSGERFQIIPIGTDPARAVWTCRGKTR